jgi:hypothetical protein
VVLPDNVVVKNPADFLRRRDAVSRFTQRGLFLLLKDVLAQLDAFIADEHRRPRDELAHLMLALAAERAVERTFRILAGDLAHPYLPVDSERPRASLLHRRLAPAVQCPQRPREADHAKLAVPSLRPLLQLDTTRHLVGRFFHGAFGLLRCGLNPSVFLTGFRCQPESP